MILNKKIPGVRRWTRQRWALWRVLNEAERPLSPQELLRAARRHVAELGLATVYRWIAILRRQERLTVVRLPGQAARYERATPRHRHHFECERCGRVYPVRGCPGALQRFAPPGFVVRRHTLILHGACASCRPGNELRRRARAARARSRARALVRAPDTPPARRRGPTAAANASVESGRRATR